MYRHGRAPFEEKGENFDKGWTKPKNTLINASTYDSSSPCLTLVFFCGLLQFPIYPLAFVCRLAS